MTYQLTRKHSLDQRDTGYLINEVVPRQTARGRKLWPGNYWWGDQGNTPHCVAYAWIHWLEDAPVIYTHRTPVLQPSSLYAKAQRRDEWPGTNYAGTSVRGGAKVLKSMGYINAYRWAWDAGTVIRCVLEFAPVVIGINWYSGMMRPTRSGFIRPTGRILGGHAVEINGVNLNRGWVRVKNSWGRRWGIRGYAYLGINNLHRLLQEDGEACLAIERTRVRQSRRRKPIVRWAKWITRR